MINAEQYLAEIDARAMKYAAEFDEDDVALTIKRAMLDAASLVNDAWLREMARVMEECKPK